MHRNDDFKILQPSFVFSSSVRVETLSDFIPIEYEQNTHVYQAIWQESSEETNKRESNLSISSSDEVNSSALLQSVAVLTIPVGATSHSHKSVPHSPKGSGRRVLFPLTEKELNEIPLAIVIGKNHFPISGNLVDEPFGPSSRLLCCLESLVRVEARNSIHPTQF